MRPEALLKQVPNDGQKCPNFSAAMQRTAIFEVLAKVIQGRPGYDFVYN